MTASDAHRAFTLDVPRLRRRRRSVRHRPAPTCRPSSPTRRRTRCSQRPPARSTLHARQPIRPERRRHDRARWARSSAERRRSARRRAQSPQAPRASRPARRASRTQAFLEQNEAGRSPSVLSFARARCGTEQTRSGSFSPPRRLQRVLRGHANARLVTQSVGRPARRCRGADCSRARPCRSRSSSPTCLLGPACSRCRARARPPREERPAGGAEDVEAAGVERRSRMGVDGAIARYPVRGSRSAYRVRSDPVARRRRSR